MGKNRHIPQSDRNMLIAAAFAIRNHCRYHAASCGLCPFRDKYAEVQCCLNTTPPSDWRMPEEKQGGESRGL